MLTALDSMFARIFNKRHGLIYESFSRGKNEERKSPSTVVFNAPVISCVDLSHSLARVTEI